MTDILSRLTESLDPDHPTPAYHQLAAIVRWEIAEGRLPIGTQLPPIRTIAAAVDLNYHTIRRALGELEAEGIITLRRGRGGRVVRAPRDRSGWSPAPLGAGTTTEEARVWVVAASLERATHLATSLTRRWSVAAVPYPIDGPVPPPGVILAVVGVPEAWGREGDVHSLDLVLEPATVVAIRQGAEVLGLKQVALVAAAGDEGHPLTDLLRQLPRLGLATVRATAPDLTGGKLNACFPIAHDRLDWATRSDPRVIGVELDWAPGPLARTATQLGWKRAA